MPRHRIPLGPYELDARIGRGGMGEIWRAVHRDTGVAVAVKMLRGAADDAEALERELRACAALDHPHVVRVFDTGIADRRAEDASVGRLQAGTAWFSMELLTGGALSDRLSELDWAAVLDVLRATLSGLAHAHARGVLHRDIKPSNLLFAQSGPLKLADFGMVHHWEASEGPVVGGTPKYMAPEQFDGDLPQGPYTDLYSVGCLAWRLISGRAPFSGSTLELYEQHRRAPVPALVPRFPVPTGIGAWVARMMAKAPRDRPAMAAEALAELESLAGHPSGRGFPECPIPEAVESQRIIGLGLFGLREHAFAGRRAEREVLWQALRAAKTEGRPQVVLLRGPAGVGKSHLTHWLAAAAHEAGLATRFRATHHARPRPRDGMPGLLERALQLRGASAGAAEIERVAPGLARWAKRGVLAILGGAGGEALDITHRSLVYEEVLRELSGGGVPIVSIEDLQWADEAPGWLANVLERGELGMLVVATIRDEALASRPVQEDRIDALERRGAVSLRMGRMDDDDQEELFRSLGLSPQLGSQVRRWAEGNPLFAVQLVRDWIARGFVAPGRSGLVARTASPPLPRSQTQVWTARLERILADRPEWEAPLELAAMAGVEVEHDLWAGACHEVGARPPYQLVLRLLVEKLAESEPGSSGGRWSFVHGMFRAAVLDRAAAAGRLPERHAAWAASLPEVPEHARERARHLRGAGRLDDAVDALWQAYEHLWPFDRASALNCLLERESLLAGVPEDDPRRVETAIGIADLRSALGEEEAAWQALAPALRNAREPEHVARALLHASQLEASRGHAERASELLDEAEPHVGGSGPRVRSRLYLNRLLQAIRKGDYAAVEPLATTVVDLPGASAVARSHALRMLSTAYAVSGRLSEAQGCLDRAREILHAAQHPFADEMLANADGELARQMGDLETAARAYRLSERYYHRTGRPPAALTARLNLALTHLASGELAEAVTSAEAVLAHPVATAMHHKLARHLLLVPLARLGDWDRCEQLVQRLDRLRPMFEADAVDLVLQLARVAHDAGRDTIARWAFERARLGVAATRNPLQASQLAELSERFGPAGGPPP